MEVWETFSAYRNHLASADPHHLASKEDFFKASQVVIILNRYGQCRNSNPAGGSQPVLPATNLRQTRSRLGRRIGSWVDEGRAGGPLLNLKILPRRTHRLRIASIGQGMVQVPPRAVDV